MDKTTLVNNLSSRGLRVTPQRIAILEAIIKLDNHPSAEHIIEYIKKNHPSISVGTVYKVLDSFVENRLLNKVKTESGTMRFDPLLTKHHHLFCEESDRIKDYEDDQLDKIIMDYFKKNNISNFEIQDIKLHISGKFKNKN